MAKFFQDLMLDEHAVYTLCGSKPMTRITLYHYTEEECQAYLEEMSEEQKKNGRWVENYDLPQNWEKNGSRSVIGSL